MTREEREWWRKYNRYLNSYDWQRTRKAALKRDGNRCVDCGTRGSWSNPLQADHLSYAAYNATGHTPLDDLQTLCRSCHQKVTGREFGERHTLHPGLLISVIILIASLLWLVLLCVWFAARLTVRSIRRMIVYYRNERLLKQKLLEQIK